MERKMFKAEKNSIPTIPTDDVLCAWFSLLVKFPSPVMFAIVFGGEIVKLVLTGYLLLRINPHLLYKLGGDLTCCY